ncbi:MAG TPA: ATP-dependent metallopeptidase FtsH/Yme1/Tma family protein [Bryobacteraceae bacterium]|nr:ATP-dependent metallopeptidase FtsH/Yme1/Tma family protein [Bryobacteraceae bacterium]
MKKAVFFLVLMLVALAGAWVIFMNRSNGNTMSYTEFLQRVQTGQFSSIKIDSADGGSSRATIRLKSGGTANTILPPDYSAALKVLEKNSVSIEIQDSSTNPARLLVNMAPFFLLLAFWVFLMFNRRSFLRWHDSAGPK